MDVNWNCITNKYVFRSHGYHVCIRNADGSILAQIYPVFLNIKLYPAAKTEYTFGEGAKGKMLYSLEQFVIWKVYKGKMYARNQRSCVFCCFFGDFNQSCIMEQENRLILFYFCLVRLGSSKYFTYVVRPVIYIVCPSSVLFRCTNHTFDIPIAGKYTRKVEATLIRLHDKHSRSNNQGIRIQITHVRSILGYCFVIKFIFMPPAANTPCNISQFFGSIYCFNDFTNFPIVISPNVYICWIAAPLQWLRRIYYVDQT